MPYYDYQCEQCERVFTRKESFEEHDHRRFRVCPECGGRKSRQLVPAAYVQTSKKS